jgi:hypothetical protein
MNVAGGCRVGGPAADLGFREILVPAAGTGASFEGVDCCLIDVDEFGKAIRCLRDRGLA